MAGEAEEVAGAKDRLTKWYKHTDNLEVEGLKTLSVYMSKSVMEADEEEEEAEGLKIYEYASIALSGELKREFLIGTKRLHGGVEMGSHCNIFVHCRNDLDPSEREAVGTVVYTPESELTDADTAQPDAGEFSINVYFNPGQFEGLVHNVHAGRLPNALWLEVNDKRIEIEDGYPLRNTAHWPDEYVQIKSAQFQFPIQPDPDEFDADLAEDDDIRKRVLDPKEQRLFKLVQESCRHLRTLVTFCWLFAAVLVGWLIDNWWG